MTTAPLHAAAELVSVDPATLDVIGHVAVDDEVAVAEAVAESRAAADRFGRQPLAARASLLRRVAHELVEAAAELASLAVHEVGKPVVEAYTSELFVCLDNIRWLPARLEPSLREERLRVPQVHLRHKRPRVRYRPVGVVGIVSPWNFPLGVPMTQVATAVAAGNGAVLKPSELAPLCGAWVEEVFRRAGAPPGLVRVVQGPGETTGDALVRHHGIDHIVFTGSPETGRRVAGAAAARLCPATLELGGKDPMLVLADADLERAVAGALWASFTNCGQVCSGVERIYVAHGLHDGFVERLAAGARELRIGHGVDPTVELGPLVSEAQRARVEDLIDDASAAGAEIVCGGRRPDVGLPGWFLEPVVVSGEPPAARMATEEVFGPLVSVVSCDNDEEAIARANASRYALGASVWTRDRDRGRAVGDRLVAGSVWLNDHAYSYGMGQAPWGGSGLSGHGRTHARHGLESMSHVTYRDGDGGRLTPPWWFPYSDRLADGFAGALVALYGHGVRGRGRSVLRHRRGLAELGARALGR